MPVLLINLCISFWVVQIQDATRHRAEAIINLEKAGGILIRDENRIGKPVIWIVFNTPFDERVLSNLSALTTIESLWFQGTNISDTGMWYLGQVRTLRHLDIWGGAVSDVGLKNVRGLTRLERLTLYDLAISDDALQHLEALRALKTISFCRTKVTNAGLERLRRQVAHCNCDRLRTTDGGIAVIRLGSVILCRIMLRAHCLVLAFPLREESAQDQ